MTQAFKYRPRSLRDVAVRTIQTATETDKSPRAEPEALCQRPGCGHARWCHCDIRRSSDTRTVLFYARHRGEYLRVRCKAYSAGLYGYSIAVCKHFAEDQPNFPCCSSSACAVRDCRCISFASPYRKARVKKQATAEPKPRRKKVMEAQFELELFAEV